MAARHDDKLKHSSEYARHGGHNYVIHDNTMWQTTSYEYCEVILSGNRTSHDVQRYGRKMKRYRTVFDSLCRASE